VKFRVAAFWISLLLAPLAHAVDSFVVPSASEAVEGDSNNTIPFSSRRSALPAGVSRHDIPPGPFTIYSIAFRPGDRHCRLRFQIPDIDIFLVPTERTRT
jgi:hypothetical protein